MAEGNISKPLDYDLANKRWIKAYTQNADICFTIENNSLFIQFANADTSAYNGVYKADLTKIS